MAMDTDVPAIVRFFIDEVEGGDCNDMLIEFDAIDITLRALGRMIPAGFINKDNAATVYEAAVNVRFAVKRLWGEPVFLPRTEATLEAVKEATMSL